MTNWTNKLLWSISLPKKCHKSLFSFMWQQVKRLAKSRADKNKTTNNHPFYRICETVRLPSLPLMEEADCFLNTAEASTVNGQKCLYANKEISTCGPQWFTQFQHIQGKEIWCWNWLFYWLAALASKLVGAFRKLTLHTWLHPERSPQTLTFHISFWGGWHTFTFFKEQKVRTDFQIKTSLWLASEK